MRRSDDDAPSPGGAIASRPSERAHRRASLGRGPVARIATSADRMPLPNVLAPRSPVPAARTSLGRMRVGDPNARISLDVRRRLPPSATSAVARLRGRARPALRQRNRDGVPCCDSRTDRVSRYADDACGPRASRRRPIRRASSVSRSSGFGFHRQSPLRRQDRASTVVHWPDQAADRITPTSTRSTMRVSTRGPAHRCRRPRPGSALAVGDRGPRTVPPDPREWDVEDGSASPRCSDWHPRPTDAPTVRGVRARDGTDHPRSSATFPPLARGRPRQARADGGRAGRAGERAWRGRRGRPRGIRYLTLPAVRPPTRRFSMIMNSTTTGMIATIETPNT